MRCFGDSSELYARYHDQEWGVPVHDDRKLFEMLVLEGAQAGLNWETILKKRKGYQACFHGFDPKKVAKMSDEELGGLCRDAQIVRNRRKIFSARQNAKVFLQIQQEFGSFDAYVWQFAREPIAIRWNSRDEVPCQSAKSDQLSKDLKRRGMAFVGTKIIYAFMQATGLVNDHLVGCEVYITSCGY